MVPSASDSPSALLTPIWRSVRSPQALLVALSGVCAIIFGLARESYPIVAYGAGSLVAFEMLVVVLRYAIKGPEADRVQPTLTIVHSSAQQVVELRNVDAEEMAALLRLAARFRRPLPLPAGVVRGSAADPGAIVEITREEATALLRQDLGEDAERLPSGPTTLPRG